MPLLFLSFGLCFGILSAYFMQDEALQVIGSVVFIGMFCVFLIRSKVHNNYYKSSRDFVAAFACMFAFIGFFNFNLQKSESSSINALQNSSLQGIVFRTSISDKGFQSLHVSINQCYNLQNRTTCKGNVLLVIDTMGQQYKIGDKIVFNTVLRPFENTNNPGSFDANYYFTTHGYIGNSFCSDEQIVKIGEANSVFLFFAKWQEKIAQYIQTQLPESISGLAIGLLVGAKGDIDKEVLQAFSNTGAMHVLAVSGMHVGILMIIIQWVFRLFSKWISRKQTILISVLAIWCFGFLSGASSAVMRAVVMFTIVAIGMYGNRKNNVLNSLFFSAILLLLFNPYYLFDVGFQLSYAALFGIILLQKPIEELIHSRFVFINWLWKGTAVGIAATITTFPFVLFWFQQFSNYFMLSNIFVMSLGTIAIVLLIITLCTSWIPFVNGLLTLGSFYIILLLVQSIQFISRLPGSVSSGFELSFIEFVLLLCVVSYFAFKTIYKREKSQLALFAFIATIVGLSFSRIQKFQEDSLQLFVSKELCGSIQVNGNVLYFYEKDSPKIQRLIQEAEKSSGIISAKKIELTSANTISIQNKSIHIRKLKSGWRIDSQNHSYFYQQKGVPSLSQDVRLLSSNLQMALKKSSKPFYVKL